MSQNHKGVTGSLYNHSRPAKLPESRVLATADPVNTAGTEPAEALDLLYLRARAMLRDGRHADALSGLLRMHEIACNLADPDLEAKALSGIGEVYRFLHRHADALEYHRRAAGLFAQIGAGYAALHQRYNAALAAQRLGDPVEALRLAEQVLSELPTALSDPRRLRCSVRISAAESCLSLNDDTRALVFLEQAREVLDEDADRSNYVRLLLGMARLEHYRARVAEAVVWAEQALAQARALDQPEVALECHRLLADVYPKIGALTDALRHSEARNSLREALYDRQSEDWISTLEVVHQAQAAHREAALLAQKNIELEAEIAERRRVESELIAAKEQAEVANQAKSEFLSTVSHELRTPLSGILGFGQLLERADGLDDRQRRSLAMIRQSAEHLQSLLNDLLDLAKIEARRLELVPSEVDLPELLSGVAAVVGVRAEEKNLSFKYRPDGALPQRIDVDEKRLRQVLLNLLGNAIKFTQSGHVSLHVAVTSAGADQTELRFCVEDSGAGIASDQLQRIFLPFEQVGGSGEGAGLGLTISQTLAKLMGSSIEVSSTSGQGSRFWFTLSVTAKQVAEMETETSNETVQSSEIELLPVKTLQRLRYLAQLGDQQQLLETLQPLLAHSALRPFAERAMLMVQSFQSPALLALLNASSERRGLA